MKIFNKIAACIFTATMMVTQAQAIELVKVEPITTAMITEAAKESLVQSMKINLSEIISVKAMLNVQKVEVKYLSNTNTLVKTNVTAE
jgi:hypothetical protein